ncbi:disintegrin and metalloproteinase domain-containing protein 1a-like, partial [Vombatus ursinus]|uniref:disintegrin and metalloproteinase domain-containing protein 1a-like n=1 Tax=Vombatus ursinus TaxID=29139 RepID=UPI000FFCFEBA
LGSLVSLSTCSGLKGIITIEKTVYNIEPIDASSEFEHVLYKMKKDTLDTWHNPGSIVGDVCYRSNCVSGRAALVESFYHEDITRFTTLMSRELGHNLGMLHDHRICIYGQYIFCIMHAFITYESAYSNCSIDDFFQTLRSHYGSCILYKPEPKKILRMSVCENQASDRGEECDCGSIETCSRDSCCLPTCRMTRGSVCAFGPCCEYCQFQLRGSVCRPSRDECDLPEYCNGTSMWCQPDVYKQDGTRCAGEGLCYGGHCRDLNKQCVEIFGKEAISARDGCYRFMNTKGDRFGNCGSKYPGLYKHFLKCAEKDAKCGKIICEKVLNVPQSRDHHTFIHVMHAETWCWAADLFEETDIPDRAQVPTGTRCGPNKICISHVCSDARLLKLECNPATKCHGRGVCNNLRHCHCDYGYAPPTCETGGHGGSMDSGPPPTTTTTTTTT